MMYVAFAGLRYSDQLPKWFRNFLTSLQCKDRNLSLVRDISLKDINDALKPYHAEYTSTWSGFYDYEEAATLEFATEQDYVMFLLRFT